jgi:hypothetical protein
MDKEEFKKEVMELIYKETGWRPYTLDDQDPDILTDIVLSYYHKGFKDGQDAMIKVFTEITPKPLFNVSMSNLLSEIKD